jgi:predicted nuclease of predicted toxin-antitoxin system
LSRLFIDLYLDEDVNVLVADLVRARGFRVTTTQAAGQKGATDANQLAFATSQGNTILTHNRVHFEALAQKYFEEKKTHSGIIIAVRRPPEELSRRILILLDAVTADEVENQIRYI